MLRTNCDRCGESADPPKGRHFVETPTSTAWTERILARYDLCETCAKGLDDYMKGKK